MSHHLDLGWLCINNKGSGHGKVTFELSASLSILFIFSLLHQTLPSQSKVLAKLNVFLLSAKFLNLFLHAFHKILGDGVFRSPRFSNPHGRIRWTQIQLLEYLILGYGVSASCLSRGIRTVLVLIEVSK